MSQELAQAAYAALQSDDVKWKLLHVNCEANRLLAIYFWLLREDCGVKGRVVDLYSKALRSVLDARNPIRTVTDLQALKHVGPYLSKIVVSHLWALYPPEAAKDAPPGKAREAADFVVPPAPKRKAPEPKTNYIPEPGSANYAFMIVLLQAHEQGEKFISKAELCARAEASGLTKSSVFGNDPMMTRRRKQFDAPSSRMLSYTAWNCTTTMVQNSPPLVEIFSRPQKILLTPEGLAIAKALRKEAIVTGKLEGGPPPADETASAAEQTVTELASNATPTSGDIGDPAVASRDKLPCPPEDVVIKITQPVLLPYANPDASFDDEFELVLLIDQRELFARSDGRSRVDALEAHMEVLEMAGVTTDIRHLELGDAIWIARRKDYLPDGGEEYILDWIVERKRVDDLAAAIVTQRYEQQKYWLHKCGISNVVYLIEGDTELIERGSAVRTAASETEVLDQFRVIRTNGLRNTLEFYAHMTQAIKQQLDSPFANGTGREAMRMCEFGKHLSEIQRLSCHKIWGLMLTRVPGIGADTATGVSAKYPTPKAFFEAVRIGGREAMEAELSEIPTRFGSRKVGKAKARKLLDCLFPMAT